MTQFEKEQQRHDMTHLQKANKIKHTTREDLQSQTRLQLLDMIQDLGFDLKYYVGSKYQSKSSLVEWALEAIAQYVTQANRYAEVDGDKLYAVYEAGVAQDEIHIIRAETVSQAGNRVAEWQLFGVEPSIIELLPMGFDFHQDAYQVNYFGITPPREAL